MAQECQCEAEDIVICNAARLKMLEGARDEARDKANALVEGAFGAQAPARDAGEGARVGNQGHA